MRSKLFLSAPRVTMIVTMIVTMLSSTQNAAAAYTMKKTMPPHTGDENLQTLQKLSKGVATIAQRANEAIVFVSVYKTVQGMPFDQVDPFEFFFGPNGPGGQGGQLDPQNPRGRGGRPNGRGEAPQRREGGLGSGFFFDLEKGYILTNNHVVQDADEIQLKLANGETYEGKIVGRDKNTDIAVVQVKDKSFNKKGLGELDFGDSDKMSVGDFVVALGAPYGLEASLSFGVVSAIGRGNLDITKLGNFIQTDAAINPGNSGGPLLDMSAHVIGINTAIYSRTGSYNGIGFAVPANLGRRVAEQLVNEGRVPRGYMGVALQAIDPELHKSLGLAREVTGSLVARVVKGGPGDKGGLQPGDVIIALNSKSVKTDSDIVNTIGLMKPATKAEMTIIRDGKKKNLTVTVEKWPDEFDDQGLSRGEQGSSKPGKATPFGMSVSKVSPTLRERYRFESETGVVITEVKPDSPAARAGLQPGDVILQANNKAIRDADAFAQSSKDPSSRMLLRIERSGQYFFVPLRK
jgi:serine protease Do